jgi:hypothetical protein
VEIATGQPEGHPTPLPLDVSATPGVVAPTPRFPSGPAQGTVASADYAAQMAGTEAACAAAQAAGHAADSDRRGRYEAGMLPLGTTGHGDVVTLPEVPTNAVPPASSSLYPWSGLEPTPAAVAVEGYPGTGQ